MAPVGEAEQNKGGCKKEPAVFRQPHGKGKTSQAETGQDEWQLSTEGIGQGSGNSAAVCNFGFHSFFLNGLILQLPFLLAGMLIKPSRSSFLKIKITLSRLSLK